MLSETGLSAAEIAALRAAGAVARPPAHAGQHTDEVLSDWLGADADRIAKLRANGAVS